MKLALVVHTRRPEPVEFARRFAQAATAAGLTVVGDEAARRMLMGVVVEAGDPEMVVAIGGDGTVLAAVSQALEADLPVFGFNLGTIGFLAEAEPADLEQVIEALVHGRYGIQPRMAVEAVLGTAEAAAGVNDVVVEKIESQRLVSLQAVIDGEPLPIYRADGLVVATPTGSTAYNFSAGGPLMDPTLEALLLSPVASHSLFARTLVMSKDTVIEISAVGSRPVRVSVDGREIGELDGEGKVVIRRRSRPARFLTFSPSSFPRAITQKFRLG
jgi:NAD+ kinase